MFSASNYWETSPNVTAWQENLSNTAHQREMADFKAAGINPMLTAQTSGASTPSGSPDDFMSNMMDLLVSTVSSSSKSMSNAVDSLSSAVKKISSGKLSSSSVEKSSEETEEKPWYDFTNYTVDKPKTPIGAIWNLGMNLLENGIMPWLSNAREFLGNSWNNYVEPLASELPDVPNSGSGKDYDQRLPLQNSHSRKHGVSGTALERAIKDAFNSFGSYT